MQQIRCTPFLGGTYGPEKITNRKESDLRGHLEKENVDDKKSKDQLSNGTDVSADNKPEDYQLNRAIELIRSINVYENIKKANS